MPMAQEHIIECIHIQGRACEARKCTEERQPGAGKLWTDAGTALQGSPPQECWVNIRGGQVLAAIIPTMPTILSGKLANP